MVSRVVLGCGRPWVQESIGSKAKTIKFVFAIRSKDKDLLARNNDNVSELSGMSTHGLFLK